MGDNNVQKRAHNLVHREEKIAVSLAPQLTINKPLTKKKIWRGYFYKLYMQKVDLEN